MEQFCYLDAMADTQFYTCAKMVQSYKHTLYNIKFLVFILYCEYMKCDHWEKMGEVYIESLYAIFATLYKSIVSQNLKFCFFFLFWPPPQHMKFLGQGRNLSWSCDLCHSCSNVGSLNHCTRLGIKPAPPQREAGSLNNHTTVGTP